jgi:hypothetical protein
VLSALIPDDPGAAALAGFGGKAVSGGERTAAGAEAAPQADFLILSKNKPPVPEFFPPDTIGLYSPWLGELEEGSYYYRNEWETIDHFLLSSGFFDGRDWEFGECEVVNSPPFINSQGHPNSYNPRTGAGLSDHLPLILTLRFTGLGASGGMKPLRRE